MKHIISALTFIALASFTAIVPALAQERTVIADVPFDFAVGNRVLPAGTYRVSSMKNVFEVRIDSHAQRSTTFIMGYPGEREAGEPSKLVFDKIGNNYFLKKIVAASAGTSMIVPKSKLEKKAQEQGGPTEREDKTVFTND